MCRFCGKKESGFSGFPYFTTDCVCEDCYKNICGVTIDVLSGKNKELSLVVKSENEIEVVAGAEAMKRAIPKDIQLRELGSCFPEIRVLCNADEPDEIPNYWGDVIVGNGCEISSSFYVVSRATAKKILK